MCEAKPCRRSLVFELTQVMNSGALERSHGKLLFHVLSEAMQTPKRANEVAMRVEYRVSLRKSRFFHRVFVRVVHHATLIPSTRACFQELFDAAEGCAITVLNAKFRARLDARRSALLSLPAIIPLAPTSSCVL